MSNIINIAISGSGVRLPALAGALFGLVESGKFVFKKVVGTSGGAIIGSAFICFQEQGMDAFEACVRIKRLTINTDFGKLIKDSRWPLINLFRKTGMYLGKKFENFIKKEITDKTLREFNDLYMIVTELIHNENSVVHASTFPTLTIPQAARRSMAIPFAFYPIYRTIKEKFCTFVDGGVTNNFAIDLFNNDNIPTIGIKLHGEKNKRLKKDIKRRKLKLTTFTNLIMSRLFDAIEREHIENAKFAKVISVNTGHISSFDFDITTEEKEWLWNQGYLKAKKWLERTNLEELK